MQSIIYHITTKTAWDESLKLGFYVPLAFEKEKFIHCSTKQQVVNTANRIFKNKWDLVLLCIQTEKVLSAIVYENLDGGAELYPHIYGFIYPIMVIQTIPFEADEMGVFHLPGEVREY